MNKKSGILDEPHVMSDEALEEFIENLFGGTTLDLEEGEEGEQGEMSQEEMDERMIQNKLLENGYNNTTDSDPERFG